MTKQEEIRKGLRNRVCAVCLTGGGLGSEYDCTLPIEPCEFANSQAFELMKYLNENNCVLKVDTRDTCNIDGVEFVAVEPLIEEKDGEQG